MLRNKVEIPMTKLLFTILVLSSLVGCSKSKNPVTQITDAIADGMSKSAVEVIEEGVDLVRETDCSFRMDYNPSNPSQRITLPKSLVERIILDLQNRSSKSTPLTFWTDISDLNKKALMLHLNLNLSESLTKANLDPYKGVAIFIAEVMSNPRTEIAYQARASKFSYYSYQIQGQQPKKAIRYDESCADSTRKLSSVHLPSDVRALTRFDDIYECRTETQALYLMTKPTEIFMAIDNEFSEMDAKALEFQESSRRMTIEIHDTNIDMRLEINKTKTLAIGNLTGYKSQIELHSGDKQLKTSSMTCYRASGN